MYILLFRIFSINVHEVPYITLFIAAFYKVVVKMRSFFKSLETINRQFLENRPQKLFTLGKVKYGSNLFLS